VVATLLLHLPPGTDGRSALDRIANLFDIFAHRHSGSVINKGMTVILPRFQSRWMLAAAALFGHGDAVLQTIFLIPYILDCFTGRIWPGMIFNPEAAFSVGSASMGSHPDP